MSSSDMIEANRQISALIAELRRVESEKNTLQHEHNGLLMIIHDSAALLRISTKGGHKAIVRAMLIDVLDHEGKPDAQPG